MIWLAALAILHVNYDSFTCNSTCTLSWSHLKKSFFICKKLFFRQLTKSESEIGVLLITGTSTPFQCLAQLCLCIFLFFDHFLYPVSYIYITYYWHQHLAVPGQTQVFIFPFAVFFFLYYCYFAFSFYVYPVFCV